MPDWHEPGLVLEPHELATIKRDILTPGVRLPDFLVLPGDDEYSLAGIRQSPEVALIPVLTTHGRRVRPPEIGESAWDGILIGESSDVEQIRQLLACLERFPKIEDWDASLVRQLLFARYLVSRGRANRDAMRVFDLDDRSQLVATWQDAGWIEIQGNWLTPTSDLIAVASRTRFVASSLSLNQPVSIDAPQTTEEPRALAPKRSKRPLPLFAAGLLLGIVGGWLAPRWLDNDSLFSGAGDTDSSTNAVAQSATAANFHAQPVEASLSLPVSIQFSGVIVPRAVVLVAPWAGALVQAPLSSGALVSAGTLVAKLELPAERERLNLLESNLKSHQQEFETAQGHEAARLLLDAAWKDELGNTSASVGHYYRSDRASRALRDLREEIRQLEIQETQQKISLARLNRQSEVCREKGAPAWIKAQSQIEQELSVLKGEMAQRVIRASTRGLFGGYYLKPGQSLEAGHILCTIEERGAIEFEAITAPDEWHTTFQAYRALLQVSDQDRVPLSFVSHYATSDGTGRARFRFLAPNGELSTKAMGIVTLQAPPTQ